MLQQQVQLVSLCCFMPVPHMPFLGQSVSFVVISNLVKMSCTHSNLVRMSCMDSTHHLQKQLHSVRGSNPKTCMPVECLGMCIVYHTAAARLQDASFGGVRHWFARYCTHMAWFSTHVQHPVPSASMCAVKSPVSAGYSTCLFSTQ